MIDWTRWHTQKAEEGGSEPSGHERAMSGKYLLLHKYLLNRYADTVVLTFLEIEDILGFALPNRAREQQDWWGNADSDVSSPGHADAWRLAHRTAKPNLMAKTVTFERTSRV
jgi:hypothetical protein